jgi:hypothetical protein
MGISPGRHTEIGLYPPALVIWMEPASRKSKVTVMLPKYRISALYVTGPYCRNFNFKAKFESALT